MKLSKEDFEKLAKRAFLDLPEKIRQKLDNVEICVDESPSPEQLKEVGTRYAGQLLGLYEGIPQTKWGRGFGMTLPDKITIFQKSIEKFASRAEEIKELVRITLWHEIAHHFGFSEKGVRKLEPKWKKKDKKDI